MSRFLSKILGEGGGQNDQHFVKNKFVKNRVGGRGVNLNLDNVFKYTVCFFDGTPKTQKHTHIVLVAT